jgi:hypothetical protein
MMAGEPHVRPKLKRDAAVPRLWFGSIVYSCGKLVVMIFGLGVAVLGQWFGSAPCCFNFCLELLFVVLSVFVPSSVINQGKVQDHIPHTATEAEKASTSEQAGCQAG